MLDLASFLLDHIQQNYSPIDRLLPDRGSFAANGPEKANDMTAVERGLTGDANMPLYSYHCVECDRDLELLMGSGDTAACPTCGSRKMERLMSRVAPPAKSRGIMKSARAQATREGHLSNYSRSERRS